MGLGGGLMIDLVVVICQEAGDLAGKNCVTKNSC